MKDGTRLYLNITNECNTTCPFCCMYSGTEKHTRLSFPVFQSIIDSCPGNFELQLEGGEPLLHPNLYLFMEYAIATKRCKKIILLSNGLILMDHLKRLVQISNWYRIPIELKISINYWLIAQKNDFLETMDSILFATKDLPYIKVTFNVRKRSTGDEMLEEKLSEYGLLENSNVFFFQSYGRLSNSDYDTPVIVQNIANWRLYACDGRCFEQDLIARSEYEKLLP